MNMNKFTFFLTVLLALCLALGTVSCDLFSATTPATVRGSLSKITYLQSISPLGYTISIGLATDLIAPTIDQSVDLYRMEYASVDPKGEAVILSALVGLPQNRSSVRAVVGNYHGTVFSAADAPSRSAFEGPMTVATYAGKGLAVLALITWASAPAPACRIT
jgi:hypothetical protein